MAFLGQEEQLREFQERFKYLHLVLFIGIGILITRLVYLQVLSGEAMRQISDENRIKRVTIPAPRGMIFDRNRTLLIDNRPSYDLEIVPQYLNESKQQKEVALRLSTLLNMPLAAIEKKLEMASRQPAFMPVKIKEGLTLDEVGGIESWKLSMPGVSVKTEIERTNLYAKVASHLLGYIGKLTPKEFNELKKTDADQYNMDDSIGKAGIEKQLEDELRGIDGQEVIEVDALGRRVRSERSRTLLAKSADEPATPGNNLILTIDQDLQQTAIQSFGDKVGGLVAIDPKSGEILSMVSKPSYDSTAFSRGIPAALWKQLLEDENLPMRDKTLQDHYPPGSVFKVVTAFAGFEEGLITEKTKFSCPGSMRIGNRVFHCHKKVGHGELDVVGALEQSCDIYFWKLAQKFQSVDQIAKWAFQLGLGTKTGIELFHEAPGLIPTEEWKKKRSGENWNQGENVNVAIGQSVVLTTVLQLANLYGAIANGGTLYKPHYLKSIESYDGTPQFTSEPQVLHHVDINPKYLELLKKGLFQVVNSPRGTAWWSHLNGLHFSGKTGTSQVIRFSAEKIYTRCENLPLRFRHHALFAGYAPSENPVIAAAAVVEHGCHGATAAAPVVRDVMKTYIKKYYPELYDKVKSDIKIVTPKDSETEDIPIPSGD